jgi:hypothetical protein
MNFVAHPKILPLQSLHAARLRRRKPGQPDGHHAFRGGALHAPLRNFDSTEARNVVLLIIDGLGDRLLAKRAGGRRASRGGGAAR